MVTFELSKPLKTNKEELTVLNLDYDALSMGDLKTANRIAKMVSDDTTPTTSPRLDPNVRIGIAWVAAIKGTPGLMVDHVLNLSLTDALRLSEDSITSYLFRDG